MSAELTDDEVMALLTATEREAFDDLGELAAEYGDDELVCGTALGGLAALRALAAERAEVQRLRELVWQVGCAIGAQAEGVREVARPNVERLIVANACALRGSRDRLIHERDQMRAAITAAVAAITLDNCASEPETTAILEALALLKPFAAEKE